MFLVADLVSLSEIGCMKFNVIFQRSQKFMFAGLYSKHVPIVPALVESWSGQVNSGPW